MNQFSGLELGFLVVAISASGLTAFALYLRKRGKVGPMKSPIFEKDSLLWSEQQAAALRAGNLAALDKDGLLEQLEDMGNERKEAFQSLVRNILAHLLKLEYSSATDPRARWVEEITEFRAQAETKLVDTPSLKRYANGLYQKAWPQARKMVEKSFMVHQKKATLPNNCPHTLDNVLDYDFFPKLDATRRG